MPAQDIQCHVITTTSLRKVRTRNLHQSEIVDNDFNRIPKSLDVLNECHQKSANGSQYRHVPSKSLEEIRN